MDTPVKLANSGWGSTGWFTDEYGLHCQSLKPMTERRIKALFRLISILRKKQLLVIPQDQDNEHGNHEPNT